jgi:glycosyltransferase involved in cell wall biosynthesis
LVLLEAMALGKPVVTTPVGGVAELVEHGRNGLLVPPEDPVALAAALRRLCDDPGAARSMGQEGMRDTRARFGLEGMFSATFALYERVLSSEGPRVGTAASPSPRGGTKEV